MLENVCLVTQSVITPLQSQCDGVVLTGKSKGENVKLCMKQQFNILLTQFVSHFMS